MNPILKFATFLVALATLVTSARADILYGNLTGYNNDNGATTQISPGQTNGKEIGFKTGATPATLTDVMLRLIIPSSTNNPPSVYLYTGGTVGSNPTNAILVTQFENPSFAAANGTTATYTFLPTNAVLLAPNTAYWIVVEGMTGTNTIGWTSGNSNVVPSGVDGVAYAMLYGNVASGSGPNTWTTVSSTINWFQVDGVQSPIIGNLGLYNNDNGTATNMPSQSGGKEIGFTTQANNYYSLSQIILRLNVQSPGSNPPNVFLYSGGSTGASPTPPTQLVTQLYSTTAFTTGIKNYEFSSATPALLAPGTTYWVVVESTATGQPDIQWITGSPNVAYTGSDETSFALLSGAFGTAPTAWTSQSTIENWMEVDGYPTIWRIGTPNLSSSEFGSSTNETVPSTYTIPSGWASSTFNWNQGTGGWPGGIMQTNTVGSTTATAWTSQISYTLGTVPPSGALFTIQASDAYAYTTQLAISSNGIPCGVIQVAGSHSIGNSNYTDYYLRPYQIYIPKECLQSGGNILQITRLGLTYADTNFLHATFALDYMQLDALATPPAEPLHGKVTYMGIDDGNSYYLSVPYTPDPDDVAGGMTYQPTGFASGTTSEQLLQEWMGMAYCHNMASAGFWSNEYTQQDYVTMGNFLSVLQNLNMTIIAPGLTPEGTGGTTNGGATPGQNIQSTLSTTGSMQEPFTGTGTLPGSPTYSSTGQKGIIDNFFTHWGNKIQFYYLTNEPCQEFSNNDYEFLTSMANYIKTTYPNTLLTSPGYAYGGNYGWAQNNLPGDNGTPAKNWDGGTGLDNNAQGWNAINNRAVLDNICDTWGGHSFGTSYAVDNGSLIETINSHGLNAAGTAYGLNLGSTQSAAGTSTYIAGPWDKPFVCTECGSSDGSELSLGNYPWSIPMDLNLRANVGFADYLGVADAFNNTGYNILDGFSWDANNWQARPAGGYLPLTVTAAVATGSTTVPVSNTDEAVVGARITGTGIPEYTTIQSINAANGTLTLSAATTGTLTLNQVLPVTQKGVPMEPNYMAVSPTSSGTGTTVTFSNPQFHVGAVVGGVGFPLVNPPSPEYRTVTNISGNTVTFNATVTASAGETCILFDSEPLPTVHPKVSRVQITRRLALAYATHGRPLPYVYGTSGWPLTPPTISPNPLVYFRAVDTSSLPALSGNTTVQNKLLLSFVNFDDNQGVAGNHAITVSVVMPHVGTYTGVRYGPGDTLAAARSTVSFTTDSHGVLQGLTESLNGSESAEYILNPIPPDGPMGLIVTPGMDENLIAWNAVSGATSYNISRATSSEGPYTIIGTNVAATSYIDTTGIPGATYYYEVSWTDGTTTSLPSAPVSTVPGGSGGGMGVASTDSPLMPGWMLSSMAGLLLFFGVRRKSRLA